MAEYTNRNNNRNNNRKPNTNNNRKPSAPSVAAYDASNKSDKQLTPPPVHAGLVEYKMSKVLADEILKGVKGTRNSQEVLCEYVNNHCGLKGYCVKVLVDLQ